MTHAPKETEFRRESVVLVVCDLYGTACEPAGNREDMIIKHHQAVTSTFLEALNNRGIGEDALISGAPIFIEGDRVGFRLVDDTEGRVRETIGKVATDVLKKTQHTTIAISVGSVTVAPLMSGNMLSGGDLAIVVGEAVAEMDKASQCCPMGAAISLSECLSGNTTQIQVGDQAPLWPVAVAPQVTKQELRRRIYDEARVRQDLLYLYTDLKGIDDHLGEFMEVVMNSYSSRMDQRTFRTFLCCLESLLTPAKSRPTKLSKWGIDLEDDEVCRSPDIAIGEVLWGYMLEGYEHFSRLQLTLDRLKHTFLADTEPVQRAESILTPFRLYSESKNRAYGGSAKSDTLFKAEQPLAKLAEQDQFHDDLTPIVDSTSSNSLESQLRLARETVERSFSLHKSALKTRKVLDKDYSV